MHSSAAPARSAAPRALPNTPELSTTRNGRSRFPPPSVEDRIASISRFGRAISSGKSAFDKSFPSKSSVSSAVWSSRFAKSDSAVAVVIKNSSQSSWPDNRLWHRLRQFRHLGSQRLKTAGKSGKFQRDMPAIDPPRAPSPTRNLNFAHCPQSVPHLAVGPVAAISVGAALSRRPSGLDADGMALYDRRAGVAAVDRFHRDLAFAPALGGRQRGREILQPSRDRLGCPARRDRRR